MKRDCSLNSFIQKVLASESDEKVIALFHNVIASSNQSPFCVYGISSGKAIALTPQQDFIGELMLYLQFEQPNLSLDFDPENTK
jgi:hypothetical protein